MKKVKLQVTKLTLTKKTITNLELSEMNKYLGGNQPEARGPKFTRRCKCF
jgi:hypothetical protein